MRLIYKNGCLFEVKIIKFLITFIEVNIVIYHLWNIKHLLIIKVVVEKINDKGSLNEVKIDFIMAIKWG